MYIRLIKAYMDNKPGDRVYLPLPIARQLIRQGFAERDTLINAKLETH